MAGGGIGVYEVNKQITQWQVEARPAVGLGTKRDVDYSTRAIINILDT